MSVIGTWSLYSTSVLLLGAESNVTKAPIADVGAGVGSRVGAGVGAGVGAIVVMYCGEELTMKAARACSGFITPVYMRKSEISPWTFPEANPGNLPMKQFLRSTAGARVSLTLGS
jgi:hypothetical protein